MKILISSRFFYPSLGGSETNAEILAHEFIKLNHQVKLVTHTLDTTTVSEVRTFPFQVIRRPNLLRFIALMRWCDVCLQNGIILKQLLAILVTRTPLVIRHQTWIQHPDTSATYLIRLKLWAVRFATSIAISQSIAEHLNHSSVMIPNPYRDNLFHCLPNIPRNKELVFLGRLVSDKGLDLLLNVMKSLKKYGLYPKLTVIGSGESEAALRQQTKALQIEKQVAFVGPKTGYDLVHLLNEHQILVIPSRWKEPFGVVALEGIACGCVVVGSSGGGLKDAIGDCGITFPNGDENALTKALFSLLTQPELLTRYRANALDHLSRHRQTAVAKAYLKVLEEARQ